MAMKTLEQELQQIQKEIDAIMAEKNEKIKNNPNDKAKINLEIRAKLAPLEKRHQELSKQLELKESLGSSKFNKINQLVKECLKEGMEVEITIPKK